MCLGKGPRTSIHRPSIHSCTYSAATPCELPAGVSQAQAWVTLTQLFAPTSGHQLWMATQTLKMPWPSVKGHTQRQFAAIPSNWWACIGQVRISDLSSTASNEIPRLSFSNLILKNRAPVSKQRNRSLQSLLFYPNGEPDLFARKRRAGSPRPQPAQSSTAVWTSRPSLRHCVKCRCASSATAWASKSSCSEWENPAVR